MNNERRRIADISSPISPMAEEPERSSQQPAPAPISHDESLKKPQVPAFSGFPAFPNGDMQMFPVMYPALVPGFNPLQNQEQMNHGAGIYAVPVLPFMGPIAGLPSNTLIPLTYNVPTRHSEAGAVGEENGQAQQQHPQAAPQRPVVRRFEIAFQLDLLLILKLAAVIFLFNQDGSRQRLVVLVFFASLVYLYQTGALTPLIRWLSQGMRRAAAPPQPPRAAMHHENLHGPPRNENAALPEGSENENQEGEDGNPAAGENENVAEARVNGGNQWWGIAKEIQMIVFGFITSLLPGFQHID